MSGAGNPKQLYYAIFNNAQYYSKGAQLLSENVFQGRKDGSYIAPAMLCNTFCLELLLKCLQIINEDEVFTKADLETKGIRLNEHRYSAIFDKIEGSVQNDILKTFNSLFQQQLTKDDYIQRLRQIGDNSFVEWRYVYESTQEKRMDVHLQNQIMDSLGKTIEQCLKRKK